MEAYLWGRARLFGSILAHISHSDKPALARLSKRLDHRPVAAVFEEALGIRSADRAQCFAYDLHKPPLVTGARSSEVALELEESLLYGVVLKE